MKEKALESFVEQAIAMLLRFRRWLWSNNVFEQVSPRVPTLSVGNLTMGGTGKTPITIAIANYFTNHQVRFAVIARAYRGSQKEPAFVRWLGSQQQTAEQFGDEPVLIFKTLEGRARVCVGESKSEIVEMLNLQEKFFFDHLLIDDGFSHLRLANLTHWICIDATDSGTWKLFPFGRARDVKESLKFADRWIVTKYSWASEAQRQLCDEQLQKISPLLFEKRLVINFCTDFSVLQDHLERFPFSKITLLAGLANNQHFIGAAKELLAKKNDSEVDVISLPDHHKLNQEQITNIRKQQDCDAHHVLVCTEKDAVKLPQDIRYVAVPLRIENESLERLHGALTQFLS